MMKFFNNMKSAFTRSTPRKCSDSHPAQFGTVSANELAADRAKWLEYHSVLEWLNLEKVKHMHRDIITGAWAEPQWIWEQIEQVHPRLISSIRTRESSLKEYELTIEHVEDLDDAQAALADAQERTMRDLLASIDNIPESIMELGVASRRHYTVLQPLDMGNSLHLESVDRWLICRDGYRGAWRWNPSAAIGNTRGEDFPCHAGALISRVCASPLDLPATQLVLHSSTTLAQWDTFLQTYGIPAKFIVMPDGVSEQDKKVYLQAALQCISNARGVLPHGTDLKSVTAPQTNVELFARRLQQAHDDIVMLMTGSTLTMQTAPDSGTLAGGAHADTSSRIAAAEADEIASVLTRSLLLPTMAQYHPQQDVFIKLTLRKDAQPSVTDEVANVVSLRSAGFSIDVDQVSSRTGWDVVEAATPPMGATPAMALNHHIDHLKREMLCHRASNHYAPARLNYERSMQTRIARAEHLRDATELDADSRRLAESMLAESFDFDQVRSDAHYAAGALYDALEGDTEEYPKNT